MSLQILSEKNANPIFVTSCCAFSCCISLLQMQDSLFKIKMMCFSISLEENTEWWNPLEDSHESLMHCRTNKTWKSKISIQSYQSYATGIAWMHESWNMGFCLSHVGRGLTLSRLSHSNEKHGHLKRRKAYPWLPWLNRCTWITHFNCIQIPRPVFPGNRWPKQFFLWGQMLVVLWQKILLCLGYELFRWSRRLLLDELLGAPISNLACSCCNNARVEHCYSI